MKNFNNKTKKGFTLVEVILAVGIITMSLTALLALLVSISASVSQTKKQAKALSVVDHVSSLINMADFETVYNNVRDVSNTYVIYCWDEYEYPNDNRNTSLKLCSSEDNGNTVETAPDASVKNIAGGEVYRVHITLNDKMLVDRYYMANDSVVEKYIEGTSLPDDMDSYIEAGLPLRIEVFGDSKSNILDASATDEENDLSRVTECTIMKMR